jgi:hypothetical protein
MGGCAKAAQAVPQRLAAAAVTTHITGSTNVRLPLCISCGVGVALQQKSALQLQWPIHLQLQRPAR